MDSLQSLESDTLTDDSEETNASRSLTNKQSSTGSECHGRETDSENDEPKFTVAQLVSAFNKHQEVTSRTSLEAIMTEKKVVDDSTQFPIGPKALRLFIPDIDISEQKPLVRRKTSYKPRKNWEELRKQNEKNEGLLNNDLLNDSGNEDDLSPVADNDDKNIFINDDEKKKLQVCLDESTKKNDQSVQEQKQEIALPLSLSSTDSGVNLRDILQKTNDVTDSIVNKNHNSSNNKEPITVVQKKRVVSTAKIYVTDTNATNNSNNNLATKISIFNSDRRASKSPTRHETKSRLAVKEKLCTGSYGRAMEKFSSKSANVDCRLQQQQHQQPRSRRTSATTQ